MSDPWTFGVANDWQTSAEASSATPSFDFTTDTWGNTSSSDGSW